MPFKLNDDRVAVLADEVPETTSGGLIVMESAQPELRYGTVVVVGNGHRSEATGEIIPLDFNEGDRVFFHRMSGQTLDIEGTDYVVLGSREIIGVFES